jgi:3-oxoacyl-(acyl-carrier-protein) synthase
MPWNSATGLQSLDIASDTILSGKAKVMLAGGFDDFAEEGSNEFANMKATSNSIKEFAAGREPTEFSRPTTSTRAGVRLLNAFFLQNCNNFYL